MIKFEPFSFNQT